MNIKLNFQFSADDEVYFKMFVVSAFLMVVYWTVGGIYFIIDITQPNFALKYKTQPGTNIPLDLYKLSKSCFNVLVNQILSIIPVNTIFYYRNKFVLGHPELRAVQSFPAMMGSLIMMSFLYEFCIYHTHRGNNEYKLFNDCKSKNKSTNQINRICD
jgi:hypothetical protein